LIRKKEKVSLIADLLQQCRGKEIALAASYLAGQIPQGRLGVGWKMIKQTLNDLNPAAKRGLGLLELSDRLDGIAAEKGAGSTPFSLIFSFSTGSPSAVDPIPNASNFWPR